MMVVVVEDVDCEGVMMAVVESQMEEQGGGGGHDDCCWELGLKE